MKTRQKQIEEMANIIKADYKQWIDITGVFPERSCYYFECLGGGDDCAELLYNAGFGDVSEYKAEIERLKAENERVLNKLAAVLLCIHDTSGTIDINKHIKQAKIDALHEFEEKLKEKHLVHDYDDVDLNQPLMPIERFIAELIKEVQNDSL